MTSVVSISREKIASNAHSPRVDILSIMKIVRCLLIMLSWGDCLSLSGRCHKEICYCAEHIKGFGMKSDS